MDTAQAQKLHQNLQQLQKKIWQLTIGKTSKPLLVSVSKKQTIEAIEEIFSQGIRNFGESFIQEAEIKIPKLSDHICWHYIGAVQSNKLKKIAQYFSWLHTLADIKHAKKLELHCREFNKKIQVCIQINVDLEPQKAGILITDEDKIYALVKVINDACPHLILRGLMCILQESGDYNKQLVSFKKLATLKDNINACLGLKLDQLSMGMSEDMAAAIEVGSTIVRVGSAIFGSR
ncbi:YggS family pyridoxal phosphate-dependent enzyme [Fastidiosibacter lacustris]|uniref:YggS family pyridoxal phosphate-dependent enzyme n=1 Tax=Fastidiosibacter lacustris TaxID=2056695 RepID=UPI000E350AD5|nr:YggS family pyridoxal phosphate-dependent enzyme [Fastidiosibacter lacustris]